MAPKTITKQEQLNTTKTMHDIVTRLQEELPGKYYSALEQIKGNLVLVNNSIAAEMQETENARKPCDSVPSVENVPCGNGVAPADANVQP